VNALNTLTLVNFGIILENFWKLFLNEDFPHIVAKMKVIFSLFNDLKTKGNLLYIRNHSVPRCKHFPPRL
jgi:hypothetical protein